MTAIGTSRQFTVRARDALPHRGHLVTEDSFEAAAAAFVEDWHAAAADAEIAIIVRDVDSGREHCFLIDLETGEAAPCG